MDMQRHGEAECLLGMGSDWQWAVRGLGQENTSMMFSRTNAPAAVWRLNQETHAEGGQQDTG